MMKQRRFIETHVVETDYGYFDVDIVEITNSKNNETYYEAYIGHQDYGYMKSMYGMSKERVCLHCFVQKILEEVDEYAEYYMEDMEYLEERRCD